MDVQDLEPQTLPRGRHGLSSELVASDQRQRILAAMAASCAEQGYAKTSVSAVVEHARVSSKTFYEQFTGKRECALAAFEEFSVALVTRIERACVTQAAWPDRVRAGVDAALEQLAADPPVAHFLTVGVATIGPKGLAMQHALFERLARGLAPGRRDNPRTDWMSPASESGLVAYLAMVVGQRIAKSGGGSIAGLAPELTEAVLIPYLGLEQARKVAGR